MALRSCLRNDTHLFSDHTVCQQSVPNMGSAGSSAQGDTRFQSEGPRIFSAAGWRKPVPRHCKTRLFPGHVVSFIFKPMTVPPIQSLP